MSGASGLGGNEHQCKGMGNNHGNENCEDRICRICLDDQEDVANGNPFIVPCKCTGSLKYIHLRCLREWTDSKK